VGICPSDRHSTKNPPGPNVYVWVLTLLPAGIYGLALTSPSVFHVPRKYSNFLCSGPGFGCSGGACASASAVNPQIRKRATDDPMLIFFSFESAIMMANPAVKCSSVPPNGLRLSGDGGAADGVRCSRWFGDDLSNASSDMRRRCASQQAFGAEVFIHIWPVDPILRADALLIPALL